MDPSYNNTFDSFGSGGGQMAQPIMSTGSGDVVLSSNQPAKKKRIGIIIGVVLILVAIGVGIAAALLFGNKSSAKNDFKEIVSFIELVPSDYAWPEESSENDSEMKDLVYAVLITNNSKNDISAYYKELNSKYDAFLAKHESALPDDLLQSYNSMLRILENAINVDTVKAELEAAYSRGGVDGAMEYYNNKVECEHENDVLEMVCDEEKDYYDVVLAEYAGAVDYDVRVNSKQAYFVGRFQDYYTLIRLSNVAKKINKEMLGALNG